jgi:hypothetical protein
MAHLRTLGLSSRKPSNTLRSDGSPADKEVVRSRHTLFRQERLEKSAQFVNARSECLLSHLADGSDVDPHRISPRLEVVCSGTVQADIFRLASLTWSVPVSEGYGRRMRFLVWDEQNGKLIGLLALGDPVFNLHVRDAHIGWSSEDRKARLVHIMDAYVLGAIAPYNMLLCGKLMACLVRTREVRDAFRAKYHGSEGVISGESKHADLVVVTTTSALGRSSVYNRLALGGHKYFLPLGYTSGYGHFHVPSGLFEDIRNYLELLDHPYAGGNRFGQGPNWKFRTIRAGLEAIGINRDILLHGIRREVFICPIARNAGAVLRGEDRLPDYGDLLGFQEVSGLALDRWVIPRATRDRTYRSWKRDRIIQFLQARA